MRNNQAVIQSLKNISREKNLVYTPILYAYHHGKIGKIYGLLASKDLYGNSISICNSVSFMGNKIYSKPKAL